MEVKEFRGCKNLVYAEVTTDDNETSGGYVTGTVKVLAPVAEISKTVDTSSEAKYYDNKAAIVINSEGADTVTLTISIPDDETLADITGRTYDSTKKMFVWRYKGTFNIPDETSATENDGTDSNNMSLEYKGVYTNHIFTNGAGTGKKGAAKAAFIRESSNVATAEKWFETVSTPDTVIGA